MNNKQTLLQPKLSTHFWWYLLGVLSIPLLGAGFIIIYIKSKELRSTAYKISDRYIEVVTPNITEKTDLANITRADVNQRWIDKRFSMGTIHLHTKSKTTELKGINNPHRIAEIILRAAEAERIRINEMQKTRPERKEPASAGSIDRLDYLTGLWQQGLITNEEFETERKNLGV
jgi:hypothetical protein